MARALTLPRLAAGLVFVPFVALLPAACGGYDTIPFDEDGSAVIDAAGRDVLADTPADDASLDTSLPDAPSDTSIGDTSIDRSVADTSLPDTSRPDASLPDTSLPDTSVADTSLPDTSVPDTSVPDAALPDAALPDAAVTVHTDPRLNSLANFAVFAGSTVTNAAGTLTTITGDLGTYPDKTAIGATPPVLIGAYHLGDTVAGIARTQLTTAYNNLTPGSLPGCVALTGQDLGSRTLTPGIYCFSTSAQLTGALVLDAGGNPNAEWIFQIGSTLTTGSAGAVLPSVTVVGANPCHVYWQVGSSATLGVGTSFSGNILASAAITLNTNTKLVGRALAVTAAVTMDTNTVSIAACP